MKTGFVFAAACIAVGLAGSANGQFVPGHVFVAEPAGKGCNLQEEFGGDRIWEIDPRTGEVTLFVQIPEEMCGFLTGLVFTPDGTRLRASSYFRSEILEFDSQGNMSVVLDVSDGIACPRGLNNMVYDAGGNFCVLNECTRTILQFPPDGGPPTVLADAEDGVAAGGAIAFASNGDLYIAHFFSQFELRRITPDGNASSFDTFGNIFPVHTVTADDSGHVYVVVEIGGPLTSSIFRYQAGDPESRELLALLPTGGRNSMTMSADQSKIYVNALALSQRGGVLALWSIDVVDGTTTMLAEVDDGLDGSRGGIAVVPGQVPLILAPAPHDILKNRYISIGTVGVNAGEAFDIRVTLSGTQVSGVTDVGSQWWVSAPDADCIAIVGPTRPVTPPNWDACPTLHLTGCPIIPTSFYDIAVVNGIAVSDPPLAAATQAKPGVKWHGDCVGFFTGTEWTAPNGETSIDDAVAAIKTFENPSATPGCPAPPCNATHVSVTDMVPNLTPGPQINAIVNIADVFSILLGFQGQAYPGPAIELCP